MVVYPRWRGELDRTASVVSSGSGLSPLARGTPVFANLWTIAIRFIPAGAGNSGSLTQRLSALTVYPHWRGDLRAAATPEVPLPGLSPLARGTRVSSRYCAAPTRFIPAGAGNSAFLTVRIPAPPVYPRWRGELHDGQAITGMTHGLSPLARGTL